MVTKNKTHIKSNNLFTSSKIKNYNNSKNKNQKQKTNFFNYKTTINKNKSKKIPQQNVKLNKKNSKINYNLLIKRFKNRYKKQKPKLIKIELNVIK